MKQRSILAPVLLTFLIPVPSRAADTRHPLGFDDLMALERISDPQISPDGKWITFSSTRYDKAKNVGNSDVWVMPITGGYARQLTRSDKRDNNARWSPDGTKIAIISSREGGPQIWLVEPVGEARKLTSISTGADGVIWSPDGKYLGFTSEVFPGCPDDACNKQRTDSIDESKVKARVLERLLFRHWNFWKDGKRMHIFVVPAEGGAPRDITPGDFDAPPFSQGGMTDYAFSPDGRELCFARNTDQVEATSTNVDLWIVPVTGGDPRKITSNPAYDGSPLYSPDGRFIAYRAQRRPGFEADRFELMLYNRAAGTSRSLTSKIDRSVSGFSWHPDSRSLFFTAADEGYSSVYRIPVESGDVVRIIGGSTNDDVQVSPNGKILVFIRQGMNSPAEVYSSDIDGSNARPLTRGNQELLSRIKFGSVESVRYAGADEANCQAWIVKPPDFTPDRKWPAVVLIHGGPQGAWGDAFSYRWNPQMFASRGYVVFAVNPRGSTGFGQKFTDEISGDWGGKVYQDIMNGVDYLAGLPYIDGARLAAAGASFGGYMINWIEGHSDRFRCLISHDGVYNLVSMFGATEELWFPWWEFKGPPWDSPDQYAKWSPSNYVISFKTPMLVIHGELDYRVPVGEALQLFTALQLRNVPSKFLYFPDEGHWVLKPQNSELWFKTMLDWIDQWIR